MRSIRDLHKEVGDFSKSNYVSLRIASRCDYQKKPNIFTVSIWVKAVDEKLNVCASIEMKVVYEIIEPDEPLVRDKGVELCMEAITEAIAVSNKFTTELFGEQIRLSVPSRSELTQSFAEGLASLN